MIQAKNSEIYFCMDGGGSRSRAPKERALLFGETVEQA
jgi:hypothetical protein